MIPKLFKREKRVIEYVEVQPYKFGEYKIPIVGGNLSFTVGSCRLWEMSGVKLSYLAELETSDYRTFEIWKDKLVKLGFEQCPNKNFFKKSVEETNFTNMVNSLRDVTE